MEFVVCLLIFIAILLINVKVNEKDWIMKCEDCNYNTGLCNSCYVKNGVEENILDEIWENKRRDEYNEDEE